MDYPADVDISNYKNIFGPTSYLAVNSMSFSRRARIFFALDDGNAI